MIKAGSKIKVHIFDMFGNEIITRNFNEVFNVYEKEGRLGIDWIGFAPLESFSTQNGAVVFEEVL